MIEINLVPDVKQELIRAQKVRSTVIAGAILIGSISIAVVMLLLVYIFTIQTVRGGLADSTIKEQSKKLSDNKDLSKILTIQNQLTKISSINDEKTITSRVFDMLYKIVPPTPNDVKISNLTIDTTSHLITIEGQAPNSYTALEIFKKTIMAAKVKYTGGDKQGLFLASNLSIGNVSYGEDSSGVKVLRFTISFEYVPELFAYSSKNASVVIMNGGNVTDSYLGVPISLFADRAKDITEN